MRLNGNKCELCESECVDDCAMCGAPQCCPRCCEDGLMEVVGKDPVTGNEITVWDCAVTAPDFTMSEMQRQG